MIENLEKAFQKLPKKKQRIVTLSVIAGVIFILIILIACFADSSPVPPDPSDAEMVARGAAIQYLKDNLKDPDSLKIVFENSTKQTLPGRNGYAVYIKYRAKNGFGAYDLDGIMFATDSTGHITQVIPDKN
jgi:hypothetical protein